MASELGSLRAEVAALRAEVRHKRRRGRLAPLAIVAVLVALIPGMAIAANPFRDLVPGSVHNTNIDLIYNAGITTGCVPNQSYCPNDLVTRQEMASFLARTAGLGSNKPVVNAATAVNASNATNAQNAINAQNAASATTAANVGGFAPNSFSRVNLGAQTVFNTPVGTAIVQLTSATVQAPGPGFVIATAVTGMQPASINGIARGSVRLRDTTSNVASFPIYGAFGSGNGAMFEGTMSPTWVFQVTSGGSRTIVFEAVVDPISSTGVVANDYALSVLYVPFGPGGAQGAEAWPSRPADEWPFPTRP
jgi:hypothetical protein